MLILGAVHWLTRLLKDCLFQGITALFIGGFWPSLCLCYLANMLKRLAGPGLDFPIIQIYFSDWVFNIPKIYLNCDLSADDCESMGFPILHTFDQSVNAPNQITIKCTTGKRSDGLADWVWYAEGYMFQGFVPSCYDPTYCETDPPVPFYENTFYNIPALGSLRYQDGESVTYTCSNPSKYHNHWNHPILG